MEPRPTPYNGPGFSMTKESLVAMGLTEEQATNTVKGADVRFLDVPFYAHLSNNFSIISWCVGYFAGTRESSRISAGDRSAIRSPLHFHNQGFQFIQLGLHFAHFDNV